MKQKIVIILYTSLSLYLFIYVTEIFTETQTTIRIYKKNKYTFNRIHNNNVYYYYYL